MLRGNILKNKFFSSMKGERHTLFVILVFVCLFGIFVIGTSLKLPDILSLILVYLFCTFIAFVYLFFHDKTVNRKTQTVFRLKADFVESRLEYR